MIERVRSGRAAVVLRWSPAEPIGAQALQCHSTPRREELTRVPHRTAHTAHQLTHERAWVSTNNLQVLRKPRGRGNGNGNGTARDIPIYWIGQKRSRVNETVSNLYLNRFLHHDIVDMWKLQDWQTSACTRRCGFTKWDSIRLLERSSVRDETRTRVVHSHVPAPPWHVLFIVYVRVDTPGRNVHREIVARLGGCSSQFCRAGQWLCRRSNPVVPWRRNTTSPRRPISSHRQASPKRMRKNNRRGVVAAVPACRTARIFWDASWPVSVKDLTKGRVCLPATLHLTHYPSVEQPNSRLYLTGPAEKSCLTRNTRIVIHIGRNRERGVFTFQRAGM